MPPVRRRTPGTSSLEYARNVHAQILENNQTLFNRAQIVLTLDGVLITAFGAIIAAKGNDLKPLHGFSAYGALVCVVVAVVALVGSVWAAARALHSRHGAGQEPGMLYTAENMWFYRRIAELVTGEELGSTWKRGLLAVLPRQGPKEASPQLSIDFAREAKRKSSTSAFETETRLLQVAITAPMLVRRANQLNWSFWATAIALIASAGALFFYLAAPPRPSPTPPVGRIAAIELTPAGRQSLHALLGAACHVDDLRVVLLSDAAGGPVVLTLPRPRCTSSAFRLTPALGSVQ